MTSSRNSMFSWCVAMLAINSQCYVLDQGLPPTRDGDLFAERAAKTSRLTEVLVLDISTRLLFELSDLVGLGGNVLHEELLRMRWSESQVSQVCFKQKELLRHILPQ